MTHAGNVHADSPKSPVFINTKAEVLDFEQPENRIIVEEEVFRGNSYVSRFRFIKSAGFVFAGFFLGAVALFVLVLHEIFAEQKYNLLKYVLDRNSPFSILVFITWFGCVLIPAMIGCLLVVFIEPKAAGGGIAGLIGYVNGVNTINTLTPKILAVKAFSVLCCITAGLAGGMEGPMVHMGAIAAAITPTVKIANWRPFKSLLNDPSRRDLVCGGMAAGIVGAFFSPIGGFIMALEEGLLYWNADIMFNILLCSVITMLVVSIGMSFMFHCIGCLGYKNFLFFSVIRDSEFRFGTRDMALFVLEGIIAGFLGAGWNYIQLRLIIIRKKMITNKKRQILEMFTLSSVTALCQFLMIALLKKRCVREPNHHESSFHYAALKLECGEGDISAVGVLTAHSQSNAIRFLFSDSDEFDILTLLIFGFIYFFLSVYTMGAFISAGIFIPNIFLGSVWGRLFGELLKRFVVRKSHFRAYRFAIIGAAAQLCGAIRIPFTLGAIMVEAAGVNSFIFPIFVAMLVTTIVGNIFNHSIYHTQCYVAGMPIAASFPPAFCRDMEVQTMMSSQVVSLPREPTVQQIFAVLTSTKHNMFPIVRTGGKLEGCIQRYQLLKILKHKLYEENVSDAKRYSILTVMDSTPLTIGNISEADYNSSQTIDLSRHINPSPYTILRNSSFYIAYSMMAHIGVRHIIVVDENNEVSGVLTRKDIMYIREHCSICAIHVVELIKK